MTQEKYYGLTDSEYDACNTQASAIYEKMRVRIELHDYILNWLESDLTSNYNDLVRERANRIIQGLCGKKYEKAYPNVIVNKLLEETLEENKRLKKDNDFLRRRD